MSFFSFLSSHVVSAAGEPVRWCSVRMFWDPLARVLSNAWTVRGIKKIVDDLSPSRHFLSLRKMFAVLPNLCRNAISLLYVFVYGGVCYNEQFLSIKSGCYHEHRCYNKREGVTRVRMTCRAFLLWLERHSSSLLSFVRFNYQFSSVICLFVQWIKVK